MRTKPILSPAKSKKCADWLAVHGVHACPLCGTKDLNVGDVVSAPVLETETQTLQKHGMPVVAVECSRCLHIMFFNAVKIGLMGKGD